MLASSAHLHQGVDLVRPSTSHQFHGLIFSDACPEVPIDMQLIVFLLSRINEPRRWTYLVAAVPPALAALAGWEAGAATEYLVVAALFVAQFAYPTCGGWWVSFLLYAAVAGYYLYLLGVDVLAWVSGGARSILLDFSDTIAYLVWVILLVGLVSLLLQMKNSRSFRIERS